jgi:predicted nuclease of restriction endonuclease-like (RecB) superfamily
MEINNEFFDKVALLIEQSRGLVGRTADLTMCVTYYEIGHMIVEQEQDGKVRAEYGRGLLKELSTYLASRVGRGFSETNLRNARKFYQVYSPSVRKLPYNVQAQSSKKQKQQKSSAELEQGRDVQIQQILSAESNPFRLGWSHYQVLMRIKNDDERHFYEIEAINEQWTQEQLKRQYNSSLYERLALSRDKDEVMRLAREGQTVEKPRDILKNPLVLEFYGLEQMPSYSESDLESAINDNLQKFLLELGKGFLFEARQKRFSFDEKSFFVDLVFYNRLLQCYVLIDLKLGEIHHQDLGQMLMYVNYFNRYVKKNFEKPTVGILLCQQKDDSIVELTLPEDSNIYASEYSLYLPDKTLLQQKLAEWTQEFEEAHEVAIYGDD